MTSSHTTPPGMLAGRVVEGEWLDVLVALEDGAVIELAQTGLAGVLLREGDELWFLRPPKEGRRVRALYWDRFLRARAPLRLHWCMKITIPPRGAGVSPISPLPAYEQGGLTQEQARELLWRGLRDLDGGLGQKALTGGATAAMLAGSVWAVQVPTIGSAAAFPLVIGWGLIVRRYGDRRRRFLPFRDITPEAELERVEVVSGAPSQSPLRVTVRRGDGRRYEWDVAGGGDHPDVGDAVWATRVQEGLRVALVTVRRHRGVVMWPATDAMPAPISSS